MSDQPKTAEGGCYCGAVRFRVTFPSRFCAHCHCSNCRRAHGAAFVTYVGFRREQLEFLAGEELLKRYATETGATRSFCTACGTTLFYEGPRWDGEILVTRQTDPGWTPVFPRLAGLVLETGGALAHGTSLCREYGLPCVTAVERAQDRIPDGARIEIDGAVGTVRLLEAVPR